MFRVPVTPAAGPRLITEGVETFWGMARASVRDCRRHALASLIFGGSPLGLAGETDRARL